MNRSAVALAADSAVTIGPPGRTKIYESANKLFELIKGSNIGVMIYSAAAINGMPWESIIKTYRQENAHFSAEHVADYAQHFLDFLASHEELIILEAEVQTVVQQVAERLDRKILTPLIDWPESLLSVSSGRVVQTRVRRALDKLIDDWSKEVAATEDLDLPPGKSADIVTTFRPIVNRLVRSLFDQIRDYTATPNQINKLTDVAATTLIKITRKTGTGIVFAGFGTKDYCPAMYSARISSRLCGAILSYDVKREQISTRNLAFLDTFAVDGPARGWINGIHDEIREGVLKSWARWARTPLRREAVEELVHRGFSLAEARRAASAFQAVTRNQISSFNKILSKLESDQFRKPMESSVAVLPKDELGLLAESLVNLTSLRQRMTINQQNTVGGAIDCAVISIGDGFVWLNRKHYFDTALNPTWHLTHGASIRTAITTTRGDEDA